MPQSRYQVYFNKKLHIAGLKDPKSGISVCTILQNPEEKRPSITAYLGARYSRSADSMIDIAEEIKAAGKDAAKRLEKIFHGYGHKSVGDMASIFVCIENVPIFFSLRAFYINSVYAGQERSTRYQDFSNPNFVNIPNYASLELKKFYEGIIFYWIKQYKKLKDITYNALKEFFKIDENNPREASALRARTFDTVRYFLPLGLKTSFGILMSARSFGEFISFLRGSNFAVEREVGEMLYSLLSGKVRALKRMSYIPEADGLVRHTEPNDARVRSQKEVVELLRKEIKSFCRRGFNLKKPIISLFTLNLNHRFDKDLLEHYIMLSAPLKKVKLSKKELEKLGVRVGKILSKYHNHHVQAGNIAQMGAIMFDGFADIGSLKDLNRHRSFERFLPFLEYAFDVESELDRSGSSLYSLVDYLQSPRLKKLKKLYKEAYEKGYELMDSWLGQAKHELEPDDFSLYTRYLFTHGHKTRYRFYASLDDLQYVLFLRTRNGGHISYRNLVYHWGIELGKKSPLFTAFVEKIPPVDPFSREQFVDRS